MRIFKRLLICILIFAFYTFPRAFAASMSINQKTGGAVSVTHPLSIKECYELALKQSETIAINAQLIKEAQAHFLQALSISLPHVSFQVSEYRTDVATATAPKRTYERGFVFSQALFSGFKELAAVSGSKLERQQRLQEKKRAEQLLFTDVSEAFYLLLEEKSDLKTLVMIRDVLKNRIRELNDRVRLGRSRKSEVVNNYTQVYQIEAQIEQVKNSQAIAQELLDFLTGRHIEEISDSARAFPLLYDDNYYMAKASSRPDVQALQNALGVAEKGVMVARSGLLPTVTLQGNYYTSRNTVPANSKWKGSLVVDVPIFEGTQALGDIKDARSKVVEAQLEFERSRRSAVSDIRQAYSNLTQGISQTKALVKALSMASNNYKLQQEDYRFNLVSNLDVLDAIRTYSEARRNFIHAWYETKRFYWQLRVATGDIE